MARLPTGRATRPTERGARPPQVLDGAGGERLLSIGRLEADMLTMTAIEWYRGFNDPYHI
jgi:hypothetical protein